GAGSALTVIPISRMIQTSGYQAAFLKFGIAQGLVVFTLSWMLRAPEKGMVSTCALRSKTSGADYRTREMVCTRAFWVMYAMFVMVASGGLMATAQLASIANDFRVASVPVTLVGLTLPALTFALSIDRILNGLTRPFFGWVSDHIGRENTMFFAFTLEAIGI